MAKAGSEGGGSTYYEIADFRSGIDHRKSKMTAPAGSLRQLINADITQGGEIEKRAAFQHWCDAPANSLGLCALGSKVYTHLPGGGTGITEPTDTAVGVIHIAQPPGDTLIYQSDYDVFNGKIYAVFAGTLNWYHYYNGVLVTEATGRGVNVRTYKEKMYGVIGRYLFFSAVGDPTIWADPPPDGEGNVAHNGSGFINLGTNDGDSDNLVALEVYYDKMAIFSDLSCQLWFLDPDPALNQYYQTLRDAGTLAPNSVRQYVANDVYFLGTHGVRSLRARDLTMTAAVSDVGSPIDPILQSLIEQWSLWNGIYWTQALLSPRTGRIWFIMPDRIFVLSNWASPNISAWSMYFPEFIVANGSSSVFADPYVVMRATDGKLFRYGSPGGLVYDSCPVQILTPFLGFEKPTSFKNYQGFDAICDNDPGSTWNVEASFDPSVDPTPYDQICVLDGPSTMEGRIPISGRSTHIQLRITHQAPGPATFSKLFIHYTPSDTA